MEPKVYIDIGLFALGAIGSWFFGLKTADLCNTDKDFQFFCSLIMLLVSICAGVYGLIGG